MTEQEKLFAAKDSLTNEKQKIQQQLLEIKNKIRTSGRMSDKEYRSLVNRQTVLAREVNEYDIKLTEIKSKLRESSHEVPPDKANRAELGTRTAKLIDDIADLREHYQRFSADGTRINSMRQMSSEFVVALTRIIKDFKT